VVLATTHRNLAIVDVGLPRIDAGLPQAFLDNVPLELTSRHWALLHPLMLASPQVVARRLLVDSLGRWEHEIISNEVGICITQLRAFAASAPAPR